MRPSKIECEVATGSFGITAAPRVPGSARRLLGWLLVLAPAALELWCILSFGVNIPIWDEWDLVPFLREVHEGGDWTSWLFRQHNEHRIAFLRLPLALIAEWSGWNVLPQMLFGFGVQLLTLLGWWRILAPRLGREPLRFAPVSVLHFGLIGYQVFLYGMMFVWSILVAAMVWTMWWLSRRSWGALVAATVSGSIASFTLINGLLVWPLGLALLFLGRDRWARRIAWTAVGATVWLFYFWSYSSPAHHPSPEDALRRPVALAGFLAATLGAPLGAGSFWASVGFGGVLVALVAAAARAGWRRRREWSRSELALLGLAGFGLLSTAAVGLSRLELGRGFALEPRYSYLSVLVIIALYGDLFARGSAATDHRPRLAVALAALIAAGVVGTSLHAWEQIVAWSQLRQSQATQLGRLDELSDSALAGIYHHPDWLRERAGYMREHRLGPFAEDGSAGADRRTEVADSVSELARFDGPLGELRMTDEWQLGVPSGEVVEGRPLVQSFPCPVSTLRDLAVPFAVHPRPNRGRVELVLAEGDEVLARTEVGAADIEPNEWVLLEAEEPVRDCFGRPLTLTVRSDDGEAGSAVAVWTYPKYYGGELVQDGDGPMPDRSVGLEINRGGD